MVRPTAIVTGASRGIGKASAISLAEHGFDVVITARTVTREDASPEPSGLSSRSLPGSLEETAEIIRSFGGEAHPIYLDLMDEDSLVPTAENIVSMVGNIDVLLSNAVFSGKGNYGRFLDGNLKDVADRVFGNVTAQMFFLRPILASMVNSGGGLLLFMTSAAAYSPPRGAAAAAPSAVAAAAAPAARRSCSMRWCFRATARSSGVTP